MLDGLRRSLASTSRPTLACVDAEADLQVPLAGWDADAPGVQARMDHGNRGSGCAPPLCF
jgi:hypothetical protein